MSAELLVSRCLRRGELGEPDWVQDRDRPSIAGDRAFAHELAEQALHHLAHGRGRICKLLLRHMSDEIATRWLARSDVEKVPHDAPSDRAERVRDGAYLEDPR